MVLGWYVAVITLGREDSVRRVVLQADLEETLDEPHPPYTSLPSNLSTYSFVEGLALHLHRPPKTSMLPVPAIASLLKSTPTL